MNKRFVKKIAIFLSFLVISLTLTSCGCTGDVYKEFKLTGIKSEKLVEPLSVQNYLYTDYATVDYSNLVSKINEFSANFTYSFSGSQNYVVAPVSVFMALSMASECSSNNTKAQLLNALGVDNNLLNANFSKLYSSLNKTYTIEDGVGIKRVQSIVRTGNSIWVSNNATPKQECLTSLSKNYHTWVFNTDFLSQNSKANEDISSFVKQFTNGQLNPQYAFDTDTLFVLLNALYLKDSWDLEGDPLGDVGRYDFTNYDGSITKKILYASDYIYGKAYEEQSFSSFYATTCREYKLKFLVPKNGYSLQEVFTPANIAKINAINDYQSVDDDNEVIHLTRCLFPEFDVEFDRDIVGTLKNQFGITDLFDENECDFSNLTNDPVYASMANHKVKLTVDKVGIEGSAVTVIGMAGAAGPPNYEMVYHDFIVDRAFGFVVSDSNEVPLFAGMVNSL